MPHLRMPTRSFGVELEIVPPLTGHNDDFGYPARFSMEDAAGTLANAGLAARAREYTHNATYSTYKIYMGEGTVFDWREYFEVGWGMIARQWRRGQRRLKEGVCDG